MPGVDAWPTVPRLRYHAQMISDGLIFDLDGTLWDAAAASTFGWNLALAQRGLPQRVTVDGIRSVSGNPFPRCVEILLPELHPASGDLLEELEAKERMGIETMAGTLYDGVPEGLGRLAEVYRLFVVSNCPDWYLDEFLRVSGLAGVFTAWDCHGSSGVGKPAMLRRMRAHYGLARPVYVGDTRGDAAAAAEAGIDFALAGYGFGAVDEAGLAFADFPALADYFLDGIDGSSRR